MTFAYTHSITLTVMKALVENPQANEFDITPAGDVCVDGEPIDVFGTQHSESNSLLRTKILAERLGITRPVAYHIHVVWEKELQPGVIVYRQKLIDLAKTSTVRQEASDDLVSQWRARLQSRMLHGLRSVAFIERFDSNPSDDDYERYLEVGPVFEDWPRRIFEDPHWSTTEPPLPNLDPLPIDQAWVELQVIPPSQFNEAEFPSAHRASLVDLDWASEPIDFVLNRLENTVVIVGGPGSGKTTLLKWIARKLLVDPDSRFALPILIPLREYALRKRNNPELTLLRYFLQQCGVKDKVQIRKWESFIRELSDPPPEDWELRNTFLLLLDGWDEVLGDDRNELLAEIEEMQGVLPTLITTRQSAAPRRLPAERMYEIGQLSRETVVYLVHRWFDAMNASAQADVLLEHFERHPDMRRLARNPFLLTLVCAICFDNEQFESVNLPRTRSDLYRRGIEAIYKHHNNRYPDAMFTRQRKRIVERLALWLLRDADDSPRYLFDAEDVGRCGGDHDLHPRVLQPSRLVSQPFLDHPTFQFLHASFQEYLAACDLLHELKRQADDRETAWNARQIYDASWQEVLRYLSGMAGESKRAAYWSALRGIAAHPDRFGLLDIRLAYFVAEAGATDGGESLLDTDLRQRLWDRILSCPDTMAQMFADAYIELDASGFVQRVVKASGHLTGELRARVLRTLQQVPAWAASKDLVKLITEGDEAEGAIASFATTALSVAGLQQVRNTAGDPAADESRRITAIRTLANARDHWAIDEFSTDLADGEDDDLRTESIEAIGRIGGDRAASVLSELLDRERDGERGGTIIWALGSARSPHAVRRLTQELACRGTDDPLLVEILEGFLEVPIGADLSQLVCECLTEGKTPEVREAAAHALTESTWPKTASALYQAARNDSSAQVREAALDALAKKATPILAPWLFEQATNESNLLPHRQRALYALLEVASRTSHRKDGQQANSLAMDAVLQALETRRGVLAGTAAKGSFVLGEQVTNRLIEVCTDDRAGDDVRQAACRSLGKLRAQKAKDILSNLVEHPPSRSNDLDGSSEFDGTIADAAADALARIAPGVLLDIRPSTSDRALERFSLTTGHLVFDDYILSPNGRPIVDHRVAGGVASMHGSPDKNYDLAVVRSLIDEALSSDELETLCLDHFPVVHNEFTDGQTKSRRVRLLVDYATRHRLLVDLVSHVEKANTAAFDEFRDRLWSEVPTAGT